MTSNGTLKDGCDRLLEFPCRREFEREFRHFGAVRRFLASICSAIPTLHLPFPCTFGAGKFFAGHGIHPSAAGRKPPPAAVVITTHQHRGSAWRKNASVSSPAAVTCQASMRSSRV